MITNTDQAIKSVEGSPQRVGEALSPAVLVEFDPVVIEYQPLADINVLTQTRKTYSAEGHEELMSSIEYDDGGQPRFELLQPLLVNVLPTEEKARQYIADLNLCHGTNHTLEELTPAQNGYVVTVAGHRRRLAIAGLVDKYENDPQQVLVPVRAYKDLTFIEALRRQIDENTHNALPVYEQAQAVNAIYKYGTAIGQYESIADCVRDLPYGDDKVRNALRFCQLPEFLQDWVSDGHLRYGAAVALHPIIGGLHAKYGDKPVAEREEIIDNYLKGYAIKIVDNGWGRDMVQNQVRSLLDSLNKPEQLQLLVQDETLSALQFERRAYSDLFSGAVRRLRIFRELGLHERLPEETREAHWDEMLLLMMEIGGMSIALSNSETVSDPQPDLFS